MNKKFSTFLCASLLASAFTTANAAVLLALTMVQMLVAGVNTLQGESYCATRFVQLRVTSGPYR